MPPKKNNEGKKPAKPRVRQVKPKLKTPTVIKIKIPARTLNSSTNMPSEIGEMNQNTPPKLQRKLTLEKKLELANEVAAAQLGTKIETLLQAEQTAPVTRKRGRQKQKCLQETEHTQSKELTSTTNVATDSEDAFDVLPKKRAYVRKNPTKAVVTKPKAVNTPKGITISLTPKKRIVKQTKLTDSTSGITKTPRPNTRSIKAQTNEGTTRKRKAKSDTGKTEIDAAALQSPSILDQVENIPKKENTSTEPESPSHQNAEPGSIDSRTTSLTSESLSWTKDISSSSTTTCVTVCSTDIVRIDKKLPVIKLTPTTCHIKQDTTIDTDSSSSDSDSDSSDSEQSTHHQSNRELTPEMESRSLDLSTSSISPSKSLQPVSNHSFSSPQNSDKSNIMDITTYLIDKIKSKLKHFDSEIIDWIGYSNEEINPDTVKFVDDIFKMLREEYEVITYCRRMREILADDGDKVDGDTKNMDTSGDVSANVQTPTQAPSEDDENNFTTDKVRYVPFDQSCDDDDALSLFAESIESSRRNSSAASICAANDYEEYVPHPVNSEKWEPAKIRYPQPCFAEKNDAKTKIVCEKQNADSTSIYKDTEQYKNISKEKNIPPSFNMKMVTPHKKRPHLMSDVFKPLTVAKSGVFRGVCFYNILSSCKNISCRFPHVIPTLEEITNRLVRLSEETFIQEYMLLRNWPPVRRQYGMCFVHECIRRDLTRIAVEMGLDFVMKANESCRDDLVLKVVVIECLLLHLNNVNLETCEDLLLYKHQGELLCEIFMKVIANTLNFSRFKPVFINLTKFILGHGRTFSLDVATQILERICILPCEPPLLEALLEIVKSTDQDILKNSMLSHFENQLSVASKQLHDELQSLKKEASLNRPVLQNLYESSPKPVPEIDPVMPSQLVCEREKRYTSPDTTNLDTMNKSTDDPNIRADYNRGLFECTIQRNFTNSNSSSNDSSEDFRPKMIANPNFKNWKDRSIFNSLPGISPGQRHATPRPMRRHLHKQMNFGPGPSKFPRRSGPDFF